MNKPLLSIIYPNYNHSHFFKNSLKAFCEQSYSNFEIIVIDDHSTDNSYELLNNYKQKYNNIRLYKNNKNLGVAKTINFGISQSKGDYIILAAADDQVYPDFFSEAMAFLSLHPEAGICIGDTAYLFDDRPNELLVHKILPINNKIALKHEDVIKVYRKTKFYIPTQSAIYKREFLIKYMFKEEFKWYSDTYVSHMISLTKPVLYIPKVFAVMRKSKECYSEKKTYNEEMKVFKSLLEHFENESLSFRKNIKRSSILTHYNTNMLYFLLSRYKYWKYVPSYIIKRIINVIFKTYQKIKGNPFEKVIQNK